MPKELKDDVAERLNKTAKELYGIDNFSDYIADETVTTDCEGAAELAHREGPPGSGPGAADVIKKFQKGRRKPPRWGQFRRSTPARQNSIRRIKEGAGVSIGSFFCCQRKINRRRD